MNSDKDKVAREAIEFLDRFDAENIKRYEDALAAGDSMLAKLYLNLIMKTCPGKLKS